MFQAVRLRHAVAGAVQECAIRGHVMQPIAAVLITDLAMLAGNVTGRIRQRPIEVGRAADVDAPLAADLNADGPAVRQGALVDELKGERH